MKKLFAAFFTLAMMITLIAPSITHATGGSIFLAYENAKEDGTPTLSHEVVHDERSLPVQDSDEFLSSKDLVVDGELIQRRYYDEKGRADLDIDYTDHGNPKQHPKVPHRHDWYWPPSGPPSRGAWY